MQQIITGTIIHGTLRDEDLLPAFLEFADKIGAKVSDETRADIDTFLSNGEFDAEFLIPELMDAIDEALPEGLRFGAHEGDGSDFGVWEA